VKFRAALALGTAIAAAIVVFAPLSHFDFVKWDDPQYITDNAVVLSGLSWHGVVWAFTTTHGPYWHPLTWLSHMLDVQLYGVDPGAHHVTNILLHLATTVLLFVVLARATREWWKSVFVAALFALHPLHVESVAWIAERKDVLSAFFWMLTMWAYVGYVERPSVTRYLAVAALCACALMSKPMAVTLPFALLLFDVWPLERPLSVRLIVEKLPLVALAAVASVVTFAIQSRQGVLPELAAVPLSLRLSNALTAYVAYIGLTFWPSGLAALYPYPTAVAPASALAGAALVLIGVTAAAIVVVRRHPYVLVGWLWFLGTLVPAIGLVQSGEQSMADRFTYIPLVGLFVIVAWGVPDLLERWPVRRRFLPVAAIVVVVACAIVSSRQVQYWSDNLTLWQRAVDATGPNYRAQGNLAMALQDAGRTSEAIAHYREALRINPRFVAAYDNLGLALAGAGRQGDAIALYEEMLRLKPDDTNAHNNLGKLLAEDHKVDEAIPHFRKAIGIKPDLAEPHNNLANALASEGNAADAAAEYREAIRLKPGFADAHNGLGGALAAQGRLEEAAAEFETAVRLDPAFDAARRNLDAVRHHLKK
jgi:Flp pilus assembly protein TadD